MSDSQPLAADAEGLDESTWIDTPENRDWLVAEWESLEPPTMTDEEWAQWQAARQAAKEYTLSKMKDYPRTWSSPSDRDGKIL
jgi:hypothetical protein